MNTGFDFVKKLRPLGSALVLVCFIGFLAVCFGSAREAIPGYSPPESNAYYAENTAALVEELSENVLPKLSGIVSCTEGEGKAVIEIEKSGFVKARAALLRYFDEELLDLVEADERG